MSPSIGKNVPKLKRGLAEARLALAPSCSVTLRPSLLVSRMAARGSPWRIDPEDPSPIRIPCARGDLKSPSVGLNSLLLLPMYSSCPYQTIGSRSSIVAPVLRRREQADPDHRSPHFLC